jgi:HPt (histidine-containing phosphotransfer) domain-containing protein
MEFGSEYDWLREIPEIDPDVAIENCGSFDGFISILTVFHKSARGNIEDISQNFANRDLPNYTIKVHGLKSAARIIGAAALSDAAKDLEAAGKAEDTEFIEAHNQALIKMYEALEEKLKKLDEHEAQKPVLEGAELDEAFQTLAEIAGSMDYGMMEGLLDDLNGYRINDSDSDLIERIGYSLLKLDWDEIKALLKQR